MDVELVALFHSRQIKHSFIEMQLHSPKISKKRLLEFFIDLIVRVITNEKGLKYIEENYKNNELKDWKYKNEKN